MSELLTRESACCPLGLDKTDPENVLQHEIKGTRCLCNSRVGLCEGFETVCYQIDNVKKMFKKKNIYNDSRMPRNCIVFPTS